MGAEQLRKAIDKLHDEVEQLNNSAIANDPAMRSVFGAMFTIKWVLSELVTYISAMNRDTMQSLTSMEETQQMMLDEIRSIKTDTAGKIERRANWWMEVVRGVVTAVLIAAVFMFVPAAKADDCRDDKVCVASHVSD